MVKISQDLSGYFLLLILNLKNMKNILLVLVGIVFLGLFDVATISRTVFNKEKSKSCPTIKKTIIL